MGSISTADIGSFVKAAARRDAGGEARDKDISRIVKQLKVHGDGRKVTAKELHNIDTTLNKMVDKGDLTRAEADAFRTKLLDGVESAVDDGKLKANEQVDAWLQLSGRDSDELLGFMAHKRAVDDGKAKKLTSREIKTLVRYAAKDGKVTLNELNALYGGLDRALETGEITPEEHTAQVSKLGAALVKTMGTGEQRTEWKKEECLHKASATDDPDKAARFEERAENVRPRSDGKHLDKLTPDAQRLVDGLLFALQQSRTQEDSA